MKAISNGTWWKIIVPIVVGLVTAIWAITWKTTKDDVVKVEIQISQDLEPRVRALEQFEAKQEERHNQIMNEFKDLEELIRQK